MENDQPRLRRRHRQSARIDVDKTPPASPQPSEPGESGEHLEDPPLRTTTITNNNLRAERERSKKLEVLRTKERLGLGLVAPNSKASLQEQAAYTSIARQDESIIAWIIKQPVSADADFYSSVQTPYITACTLLEKARVLGNQSSRYHAAQFLQTWRELGTPFRARLAERQYIPTSQQQHDVVRLLGATRRDNPDRAFCFAWNMCTRYEGELAAVHIESRWVSALLGQAYTKKIKQIQDNDKKTSNDTTRNRYGKGPVRTEAITALMKLVYTSPTEKDKLVFRNRLKQAVRWYTVVQGLGWGILTLIPHDEISNRWIERVLRVGQLHVFIELVKKERPDLCAASKALEDWLGPEGIAGGPIGEKKTLSIEAEAPATIYEVEEIQDSEDDEVNESVEVSQSQATPKSPAPAPQLRQLTLLELFHPVD